MHYDGPDLEEVCALTGLSRAELVAAHTGTPWRAAFVGFAPGFAYLTGGDERLQVPRRTEPRTSVPPGSVGLAGGYSAVYPRASPGGWQLIGHTDVAVWDVDREPPALLPRARSSASSTPVPVTTPAPAAEPVPWPRDRGLAP